MNRNDEINELFETFLNLKNIDECYDFFEDLCTYKEINAMATRLQAAKLLKEGLTYEQVIKETKISSATLSRVSKCVRYGKGYNEVIK